MFSNVFRTQALTAHTAMSTLSIESLYLKDDDCPSPDQPQDLNNEYDTDFNTESDGKYIK